MLLQQRHPLRVYIPTAADDAVQVDTAGHPCSSGVSTVPYHLITSCYLHLIYHPYNLLPQQVVDGQSAASIPRLQSPALALAVICAYNTVAVFVGEHTHGSL